MVLDAGTVEVQPAINFFCTGGELIIYCTATRKQKDNARRYLIRKQI